MFSDFKRLFGSVSCEEKDGIITISGVPTYVIERDISKLWKSSKISNNIIIDHGRSYFSFYSFFALEIDYVINKLLDQRTIRASRNTLRKISDELRTNTWISKLHLMNGNPRPDHILDYSKLNKFDLKPLEYHQRFFEEFEYAVSLMGLQGYILAGAPGSGKTLVNLMLGEMLRVDYVYIVCPKNATINVWEDNIVKRYKVKPTYWVEQYKKPYNDQKIVIVHYEALDALTELSKKHTNKNVLIILDESHNLNELDTGRTQKFIKLCKSIKKKYVVWASGTPIKALGAETIPIFSTIDPLFTDEVVIAFKKIYGKDANTGLDILMHRIGLVTTFIEKRELKLQEPNILTIPVKTPNANKFLLSNVREKMTQFIKERVEYYKERRKADEKLFYECLKKYELYTNIGLDTEYMKYNVFLQEIIGSSKYRHLKDEMAFCTKYENQEIIPNLPSHLVNDFKDVRSIIKYTPLKIQGECLGRVLGGMRIECITELAKHVDYLEIMESTEKKTVVFTSYVNALEAAKDTLEELGCKPAVVYAKTNANLNNIIKEFEVNKNINPLVATFDSLSTAVPLTMADTMIMLNVPFRAYVYDQAIARIHRLGASTQITVNIISLDTGSEPNLSTRSVDILKWSQSQVQAILGIESPYDLENNEIAIEEMID